MSNHRRISTGSFFGLLLIVVGIFWVLHNTNMIDFQIRVWWPLILIVIGLLHLYHHRRIFDFVSWLMIGLGVIFLLTTNNIIDRHEIWKYWPILLVIVGISIVFNRGRGFASRHHYKIDFKKGAGKEGEESRSSSEDRIDESTIFGSISKRITTKSFKGGSISVVFGGAEIDLRSAQLAEKGAVLDISTIFGGVDIRIPESWVVQTRSSAVLGGVDAKYSNTEENTGKRLVINASAIFGGVDISN
jgi:predicted membrane protein